MSEKSMNSVVTTLAPSFLIGSYSSLQATRKPIKSQVGLKFGKIGPWTVELAALEKCVRNVVTTLSVFNLEWIFFILADKKDNYKSLDEFEIHQDPITYYGVSCP